MLKVKPFKQPYGYCGLTCLKMVLNYHGVKVSEDEIAELMGGVSRERGVRAEQIIETARGFGFESFLRDNCSIGYAAREIRDKCPIIFNWFPPEINVGHYSVAVGVDDNSIIYAEPLFGDIRRMTLKFFDDNWFDFEGDIPPENPDDYIQRRLIFVRR